MNLLSQSGRIGQIWWRVDGLGFEIRHERDGDGSVDLLRKVETLMELEEVVRRDGDGQYRPLRGERNLVQGWFYWAKSSEELREVLEVIYPGAVGNWEAEREGRLVQGDWKGAAKRQMGRVQKLIENGEKSVERAEKELCQARCGKSPLWAGKTCRAEVGRIPLVCVEPCPIFWDVALGN